MHLLDNARLNNQDYCGQKGTLSFSGPALLSMLTSVLDKGLPFRFQAKGFSMSPFIKDGDIITVCPLNQSEPLFGNIVACLHPETNSLVIHRVVREKGLSYLTMGDNITEADGLVPKENILGVVRKINREGKGRHLGLGPERYLIAFLNRKGLLWPLLLPVWNLLRPIIKKREK